MQQKKNFQHSVHGGYYTTLSYDIVNDSFVLFTFAKIEEIWFDTLVPDKRLALLHVLHTNYISDRALDNRLKLETLV